MERELKLIEELGSPSTRRAWIEIEADKVNQNISQQVALHPEGVDRNAKKRRKAGAATVALHPEGVDRNKSCYLHQPQKPHVALHPEGVDRNRLAMQEH